MKHKVQFNELLGNKKLIDIIQLFLEDPSLELSQVEIMNEIDLAKATAVKWLALLVNLEMLNLRKIGATNLYTLNKENILIKELKKIYNLI